MHRSLEASLASRPGRRGLKRAVVATLAALVGASCLAACGSSSSSSSGAAAASAPSASSSTSSSSSSSSTSGSAVSACVHQATTLVDREKAQLSLVIPTTKVDMSALKGKTVWYISASQATGYSLAISKGLATAGKASGVNIQIFDGKGSPTLFVQGVNQAVAQKAAGIILGGINPALVPVGLAAAKAAHVPVMSVLSGVPVPSTGTLFEAINENVPQESKSMADYAAYITGCKANTAVSLDPLYPALVTEGNTIKAELAKLCPTTCSVINHQMSLATMATALAPSVQNLIQRTPNLNTIFATFDQVATYEQPAVASSSSKVKIIGTDGLPPNIDSIRTGKAQIADVAFVPPAYMAWLSLDQVARAALGKPTGINGTSYTLPVQTFDKSNVGTSDSSASLFPKYADYQSQFESLWGVS
jgi:ribose transport system substrate-binding protein